MIYSLVTEDALTVYWEKPADAPDTYLIFCNDLQVGRTAKTHYTLEGLQPDTEYRVTVQAVGEMTYRTAVEKERLDVTSWGAVGDGKTINTLRLQAVIDACGAEQKVYFPKGIYLTGALRLHSENPARIRRGMR